MIMDKEIFKDPIYQHFFAALIFMLDTKWKRKQSELGRQAGISKGHMSDIKNGNKKASFEQRNNIANVCQYTYEAFINLGFRKLGGELAHNIVDIKSHIEEEHFLILKGFKHKEKAKVFNERLVYIESVDENAYDDLYRETKATYKTLKRFEQRRLPKSVPGEEKKES